MKRIALLIILIGSLTSCLEQPEPEVPAQPSFLDQLPDDDRDILLMPLERALDDVKEAIKLDPSYFEAKDQFADGNIIGSMKYKLDGQDTVMAILDLHSKTNLEEHHEMYFDKTGSLFYTQHEIRNIEFGYETGPHHRMYKFYFNDDGSDLSAYARTSFDGEPLPEDWTPVEVTKEERQYLLGKLASSRPYFSAN